MLLLKKIGVFLELELVGCIVDGIAYSFVSLVSGTLHSLVCLGLALFYLSLASLDSFVCLGLASLDSLVCLSLASLDSSVSLCLCSVNGSILGSSCISLDSGCSIFSCGLCSSGDGLDGIDDVAKGECIDVQLLKLLSILLNESLNLACIGSCSLGVAAFEGSLKFFLNGFNSFLISVTSPDLTVSVRVLTTTSGVAFSNTRFSSSAVLVFVLPVQAVRLIAATTAA